MNTTLMVVSLILISNFGLGQQATRNVYAKDELKKVPSSSSPTTTSTTLSKKVSKSSNPSPLTEADLQKKINAYQVKIDYLDTHTEEKEKAIESGTYGKLVAKRDGYTSQLTELQQTKK